MATFADSRSINLHSVLLSGFHGLVLDGNDASSVKIATDARKNQLDIVAKVSPGRDATKIKPWSSHDIIDRRNGETYRKALRQAFKVSEQFVLIDSFNDWCAGTQIEPAAPKHTNMFTASNRICGKLLKGLGLPNEYAYPGYYNDPSLYIRITHEFASHPERTSL